MKCDMFKRKLCRPLDDQEKAILQQQHELPLQEAKTARESLKMILKVC